jgi:tetratricopeptide (TPR) repeat protein
MFSSNSYVLILALSVIAAQPGVSQNQNLGVSASTTSETQPPDLAPIGVRPLSLPAAERLGDQLMEQHRYQAALEIYSRVQAPSAKLWARMGNAYQLLFSIDIAVRCYKEALRVEPDNPRNLNNLATALDQLGEHVQAELLYRRAISLAPDDAIYRKNLGTNLLAQNDIQKGTEAYRQALAIDPHILDNRSDQAMILSSAQNAEINYARARSCAQAGNTDCALDYLRKALQEGSATKKRIAGDVDFQAMRNDPGLQQLLAGQK